MNEQIEQQMEMLSNRVRKNARHRRKWARRTGVSCYRLYDRDIPEIPLAIDLYENHLHIAEYGRRGTASRAPEVIDQWAQATADTLDVSMDRVFTKSRVRHRAADLYRTLDDAKHRLEVNEGHLRFIVNLKDERNTGLFLDRRQARAMVRRKSEGSRVLNLFAYTGSFTVYAADGGAQSTTTVDLSETSLNWAKENLALNALDGEQHVYIQADAMSWCAEAMRDSIRYDVIILDPPTYSNSKTGQTVLDIQRDHGELIGYCLELLAPSGHLLFSTNARSFRMDERLAEWAEIVETTKDTVPPDFTKPSHKSWRLELR
jgi:23S rRNA G2069 N7-methylase RlmK/C1962 C5-methylase RlmI